MKIVRKEWPKVRVRVKGGGNAYCNAYGMPIMKSLRWSVAKLDRLSRNLHFITTLQNCKVDFVAADNPTPAHS